jgi:hypothetical protein
MTALVDPRIDEIAARLSTGEPLTQICQDPAMPSLAQFYRIVRTSPEAAAIIDAAREDAAHTLAAQMLEIADTPMQGEKRVDESSSDGSKTRIEYFDNVARAAQRIQARKWLAERLLPATYGQRVQQQHTGGASLTIITGVPQPEPDADEG